MARVFARAEKLRILRAWHAGVSPSVLCQRHGMTQSTLMRWARELGRRKRDNPDAVYSYARPHRRPPDGRALAEALRAEGAPETDAEAVALARRLARACLAAGDREGAKGWLQLAKGFAPRGREAEAAREPDGPVVNAGAVWTPHAAQTPDRDEWRTWLFFGGRGAGKTRAGAEWLHARALALPGARLALVGPSLHDVREVMVEGASGLRNLPGRERPRYEASRRRLLWSNGATAYAYSAEDPESLRGPQHAAGWADEFCVWAARGRRWPCCGWG